MMEVLTTPDHLILLRGQYSLWFNRCGPFQCEPKSGILVDQIDGVKCLGQAQLLIGRVQEDKLLLATRTQSVGRLPAANGRSMQVQKIRRVTLLSLHSDCEWGPTSSVVHRRLPLCPFHELTQAEPEVDHHVISTNPVEEGTTSSSSSSSVSQSHQQTHMGKTWHSIKSTSGRLINRASSTMASAGGSASSVSLSIPTNETAFERMKRRILNEIVKMFNESDSFYFSEDSDLSQCLQRSERKAMQSNRDTQPMNSSANPLLESIMTADSGASNELATSDDRFFFNRHMLSFLNDQDSNARPWLIPVIQGFVQIERCRLPPTDPLEPELLFDLALVSRRSRHRAGTRYKRRGTDEQGHAANFVESEQLLCTSSGHVLSFVQTRGSVPVHWAQPGVSYRPAPVLERSSADNRESFRRHFERELAEYGPVTAINLVEQSGREKVLADAYLNHVLDLDEPKLTYVSFDFHEICRGMRFENVAILVEQLHEQIRDQRYFWRDHHGPVCEQRGVFRVNCVDCLDRTNLVQSALAKAVLHTQLTRLAMLAPDVALPHTFRRAFQALWANNGDTISRQYAGTSALKGDYTRTGERRLAGVVRDSYNSASRYYLNRFRDAYRQAAIDTLLGRPIAEPDLQSPDAEDAGSGGLLSDQDGAEAYKREMDRQRQMIDHCRKMCINESEPLLGAWALWNAQHGSPSVTQDCVLLLSKDCYYLIDYDDLRERIIRCQCVLFEDLERIEFGPQGWSNVGAVNHGHHHHRHHHRHHHQNHHNHHLEKSIVIGSDDSNRSSSPNRSPKSTHRPQPATTYCLRIHYLFGLQSGYFHLLQANPAFLLGTASNEDPAEEQLRAIVQAFKLALSVRSLNVPLFEGKLERRRSKRPEVMLGDTYGESARVRLGAGVLRQARQAGERNLRGLRTAGQQAMHQVSHRFARFRQKFTKSPTSNAGLTTTTVADDTPVTVDTTLVITPDTEHSAIDVEDNEYDAIEEDDLLDIEDEEVDDEIDVDDEEELPDDDEDDYDDDDVLHESNRRRRRQLRQLLHSSSSTLDTSLASKCRSNTTLERTADLIQSPVERQSSSECSDQYDYDNRLTIGHDAMADGASSTFDCFEEPQSMPVQVVVQSKQAHHTLLESCGILTGQSWSIGPDQAQHSANTNRASSAVHVDTLIQDSKTDSDVTNASASVRPLIEVTPVDNAARSLSGNRPLSRSTVQLTDRSRTGADHRHRDGDTVARVVHISGGSTGSDTTGPVTSLPVHGGNDLTQTSSSCASSIACIAGAVGASRNSDSIGNALDRIRGNQSLLDATCQPIVQLKEYTRSNLDISHGIIGDKDHGTSIMMTGGGAEVSRLFANGHSINRTAPRMKNSQSECCIQEQPNESSVSKRDLIFNPLSRIARGVQHLNLNRLNPQQLMRRHHSNHQLEDAEYEWLQQRKRESRSKIIEF